MTGTEDLRVGMLVHGFANGVFGRDSYQCRRIEALGVDWVVTRSLEHSEHSLSTEVEMVTGDSLHWLKDAIAKPPGDCPCVPYDPDR